MRVNSHKNIFSLAEAFRHGKGDGAVTLLGASGERAAAFQGKSIN